MNRATDETTTVRRAGDAADKLETIESLRDAARKEIERAMLRLQREIAKQECANNGGKPKRLLACADTLRAAWNLVDCQRLEIAALEAKLEASPAVTQ